MFVFKILYIVATLKYIFKLSIAAKNKPIFKKYTNFSGGDFNHIFLFHYWKGINTNLLNIKRDQMKTEHCSSFNVCVCWVCILWLLFHLNLIHLNLWLTYKLKNKNKIQIICDLFFTITNNSNFYTLDKLNFSIFYTDMLWKNYFF